MASQGLESWPDRRRPASTGWPVQPTGLDPLPDGLPRLPVGQAPSASDVRPAETPRPLLHSPQDQPDFPQRRRGRWRRWWRLFPSRFSNLWGWRGPLFLQLSQRWHGPQFRHSLPSNLAKPRSHTVAVNTSPGGKMDDKRPITSGDGPFEYGRVLCLATSGAFDTDAACFLDLKARSSFRVQGSRWAESLAPAHCTRCSPGCQICVFLHVKCYRDGIIPSNDNVTGGKDVH